MSRDLSRGQFLGLATGAAAAYAAGPAHAADSAPILRAIPKSGEKLPVIGLGTSQVFDDISADQRRDVVKALLDTGGTIIDTAPSYGDAENTSGQAVADLNARSRVFFATKVGASSREEGLAQNEASFKKLRTDKIDLIQVHNLRDTATQLGLLRDLKAKGRIRYLGITHFIEGPQEALAEWMGKEPLDFIQLNYSLDVRDPEKRLLPMAADKGIAVLVNLPLGRGRVLNAVKNKPLPGWAADVGVTTWAQLLLKFVVSHPAVTAAIPATRNPTHMRENVIAGQGKVLTAAQRNELIDLFEKA